MGSRGGLLRQRRHFSTTNGHELTRMVLNRPEWVGRSCLLTEGVRFSFFPKIPEGTGFNAVGNTEDGLFVFVGAALARDEPGGVVLSGGVGA